MASKLTNRVNLTIVGMLVLAVAIGYGAVQISDSLSTLQPSEEQLDLDQVPMDAEIQVPEEFDSAATVYLYEEEPTEADWEDTVEFDPSDVEVDEADSEDVGEEDAVIFDNLEPGTYYMAAVDNPDNENVHTEFAQVSMPQTLAKSVVENTDEWTIYDDNEFDLREIVESDNTLVEDADGSIQALDSDVSGIDGEGAIERTIELDDGVVYLGDLNVASMEDDENAVEEFDVTVEAGGETFSEDFAGEFGDSSSDDIELGTSDAPVSEDDEIVVTISVEFDDTHTFSDSTMAEFYIEDIYGDALGDGAEAISTS